MKINHQNNFSTNLTVDKLAGVTATTLATLPTIAAPYYLAFDALDINGSYEVVLVTSTSVSDVIHGATLFSHSSSESVRCVCPSAEMDTWSAYLTGIRTVTTYSPAPAATQDLDGTATSQFFITMPAGNITLTESNMSLGQVFTVGITQDGVGSRTVTWFNTIRWVSGVEPVLTIVANKRDTFGFICTGTNTFDGYVIGQNI